MTESANNACDSMTPAMPPPRFNMDFDQYWDTIYNVFTRIPFKRYPGEIPIQVFLDIPITRIFAQQAWNKYLYQDDLTDMNRDLYAILGEVALYQRSMQTLTIFLTGHMHISIADIDTQLQQLTTRELPEGTMLTQFLVKELHIPINLLVEFHRENPEILPHIVTFGYHVLYGWTGSNLSHFMLENMRWLAQFYLIEGYIREHARELCLTVLTMQDTRYAMLFPNIGELWKHVGKFIWNCQYIYNYEDASSMPFHVSLGKGFLENNEPNLNDNSSAYSSNALDDATFKSTLASIQNATQSLDIYEPMRCDLERMVNESTSGTSCYRLFL